MIQNMNHNDDVLNGNGEHEIVSAKSDNVEVDFSGLGEGCAMEMVNYVGENLNGLDFSRGRDDVAGTGFSDLPDVGVGTQKEMDFCCHHHYDRSDVEEKVKCDEVLLDHDFLSVENTDVAMGFCDHYHYDCIDVKERANDDSVKLNCNQLVYLNALNYFLEMSAFGLHDGDGIMGKTEYGGEILNGDDGQIQSMVNVYVKMGCGHHRDGGYEIRNVNGGDGDSLNVGHDDVFFCDAGVIEKVNDGDEIPNGNNGIYYAKNDDLGFDESGDGVYGMVNEGVMVNYDHHLHGNDHVCGGDEGLVSENGFSLYYFLYPW